MYTRKGIARPQSQFPHSCVCERSIHFHDRSTYFPAAEWDRGRAVPFLGIFVSNFRYCIFAVRVDHISPLVHIFSTCICSSGSYRGLNVFDHMHSKYKQSSFLATFSKSSLESFWKWTLWVLSSQFPVINAAPIFVCTHLSDSSDTLDLYSLKICSLQSRKCAHCLSFSWGTHGKNHQLNKKNLPCIEKLSQ
jgi:hypothetical protein